MKLHLGNGSVYLEGWTNIDICGVLACKNPELVENNKTSIDNYFKFPIGQNKTNLVSDVIGDVTTLDYEDNSIDEILCVDLIDHIQKSEVETTLLNWKRVLKPGGLLIIDVDDRVAQAQRLVDAGTREYFERALKLIYCEPKDGMRHFWGYTEWYLELILRDLGFVIKWTRKDFIKHQDPHFQICAQK